MVTTASAHLAQPSSWLTTCSALMFSSCQERCIITSRVYYPCSASRSHGTSLQNANCFREHKNPFTQQCKGQSYAYWGVNVYRQGGGARKQLFLHKSRSHIFPGTDRLQGSKEHRVQVQTLWPHARQLCTCLAQRHFDLLFATLFKIIFPSHILPWMLLKSASPHICHTEQGYPSISQLCKKLSDLEGTEDKTFSGFHYNFKRILQILLILGKGANRMQENITSALWSFNLSAQNLHVDIQSSDENLILF